MDNNKILLQKRKGSKLWPGYYALPAGHIDKGENQYEALIREAKEELNIEIDLDGITNSYMVLRRNFFEIDGKKKTLCFTEKRLVTYNPKLASKKKYEIAKQIEKARNLCYSQAKRSEYGDLGKYVD